LSDNFEVEIGVVFVLLLVAALVEADVFAVANRVSSVARPKLSNEALPPRANVPTAPSTTFELKTLLSTDWPLSVTLTVGPFSVTDKA
jgi:hypothetical protein